MKNFNQQSENKVMIVGTLLDSNFVQGKTKEGKPYERGNMTIRVTQTYGGNEETSEIPVSFYAAQFKRDGSVNPSYESVQQLKRLKTVSAHGLGEADCVRIANGQLQENYYVPKGSGRLVDGWQIRSSFFNAGKGAQAATFSVDMYLMDIKEEFDRDETPTGRLILRGGLVQYGGKLDVVDFIVENPDAVDYIQRNWEPNNTYHAVGRIRVTSKEIQKATSQSSWGEDVPETTTVLTRELIVTKGSDEAYDEDMSYDPTDIRKAFNVRKADMEQKLADSKNPTSAAPKTNNYAWDE